MSILEDLDTNGAMAPQEKRKNSTRSHKPLAAVGAASTLFGGAGRRPKKPVGDLLAGSLMANLSLDDGGGPSYRPLVRNRNVKPNHQQRSKKQLYYARGGVPSVAASNNTTGSGLLSSLLVACSSTTDVAAVQQQQGRLPQRPKGYALKLAYAAAGKTYRPASTALRLKNPRGTRRSTRNIQESSLVAVTNGDESSTKAPNMRESPAPKAKNKQLGLIGGVATAEKHVAFAVGTSIAPSHKEREQNHQKDTGEGLLSLFRGEASAGESSGSDVERKARLSMLSLETIGSDQESQDCNMLSSPSPQSKTNEDLSLVRSLELCQLKAIHVADDPTSRKRIEVASPELKVDPKRRDQKKTPGKDAITAAEAAQVDVAQHTTSSTPVLAPSVSENDQLQSDTVEQVTKSGPNKARVSARMIIDLDESVSDLSDDDQLDKILPTASLHSTSPHSIQPDSTDQIYKILPPATSRSMSLQSMQQDPPKKDAIASQLDLSDGNKVNEMPLAVHEPSLPPPPMQTDSLTEESRTSHGTDVGSETARSLLGEEYIVNMSLGNPESPAKEADEFQPAAAAAAVVEARRSQRERTVTDRFTIAAHTAGGHYVPPQHPSKGGHVEQGRSAKSKQAPKPQRKEKSDGPKGSAVGPGTVADSGEESGLDRWDSDSLIHDDDDDASIETRKKTSRAPKTKPAPGQMQAGKGGGDEEAEAEPTIRNKNSINNQHISSANVWRSRRERKPTDFFHNTLGDDGRNEKAMDIDLLFSPPIDAFNDDNDSGDEISRKDDGDGSSNADQRPRRERKKTDFYHKVYSTALASADSDDEEVEELLSDEDGSTCPEPAQEASVLPARREPRRIRVAERKPLVAKRNVDATVAYSGDDWTAEQLDQLSAAMGSVEPTSASFWHDVASLVDERTESECRFKWFSIAKTPMPKLTKRSCAKKGAIRELSDDEDDIFNSSPMRGFFVPDGNDDSDENNAAVFMNHDVGSAIKMGAKTSAVASNNNSSTRKRVEPNFRPKAGYKMYLQNLKRDVARAQKEVPSRKGQSKLSGRGPRTLSETVYDSDVDVNVRLTPGGTLKVKSQYEEDDDDFWGAEYDAEDEEEI